VEAECFLVLSLFLYSNPVFSKGSSGRKVLQSLNKTANGGRHDVVHRRLTNAFFAFRIVYGYMVNE
jgi:hypothetical protein